MSFKPKTSYNAVDKVWSSEKEKSQFGDDLSMGEIIFQEMLRHPKDIAQILEPEGRILLRQDLLENTMRIATFMRNLELTQSHFVGIVAGNSMHISAVAYACLFNGIAINAINPAYIGDIIKNLYQITQPRLIFCDGDVYEKVKASTAKLNVQLVSMRNHPEGVMTIEEVLQTKVQEEFKPTSLKLDNIPIMAILSTSGTTGTPRAVAITNNRKVLNGFTSLTTSDVQYAASSLDWAMGLMVTIAEGVYSTKRIISEKPLEPSETLKLLEKHQVTWIAQSPAQAASIVSCPFFKEANLESLRYYNVTGGRCTMEVQKKLRRKLGRNCINFGYGSSELGSYGCINWHFDEKPNSVGRLCPGYKMKIINGQGENLGPNEEGEVCIDMGSYWPGYYGNPEATALVYKDNWLHSGDLGYVDDDGFVYIVERKKDLLKYQSNKYYPHELEELISRMPGVVEACAFGIWNVENGDEAAACIVRNPDVELSEQEVIDYVAQHANAPYLRLHAGCLIVESLKRSPNGKTNRAANKKEYIKAKGIQIET
ncbi:luciferin 4-monooxygenase-like [Drosophila serrata]|uniref:luciferin 4-monooxygenase-like n=1 Tax=Drosophila serrata TaxID=7274 RepID=UPI000A1D2D51|nr:luciferin 4-monooxygenase-like [Drosophila serrata]